MPIQTECGLVVYITKKYELYKNVFDSLGKLQHRGRESYGIGYLTETSNNNYTHFQNNNVEKYLGVVEESKLSDEIKRINSKLWYGHVRYSTSGIKNSTINFTQPILYSLINIDDISIVYNGNIPLKEWEGVFTKYPELKSFYYRNKTTINDTFLILEFLKILKIKYCQECYRKNNTNKDFNQTLELDTIIEVILIEFIKNLDRAFCLVLVTKNNCWVIRDKFGVRPLTLGRYQNQEGLIIASESCCFPKNTDIVYDIQPGSLTLINNTDLSIKNIYNNNLSLFDHFTNNINTNNNNNNTNNTNNLKHCLFEYLYFMRPETTANNINVKQFREELGRLLIKEMKEYHPELYRYFMNIINNETIQTIQNNNTITYNGKKNDQIIVCGIPKSGIIQAESFAKHFNVSYLQFIKHKKEYPFRTFILENNQKRNEACHKKYFIEKKDQDIIKNKILILIDDSIVRGNTVKYLIEFVNNYQPKEIHFMVSAPPIVNVCHYGVDFPNIEELIINKKTVEEYKEELNIKSLVYLKHNILNNLSDNNKFCLECF